MVIVVSELVLTLSNSVALWQMGYILADVNSPILLIWGLITRTPVAFVRALLSALVIPLLLPRLQKVLQKGGYTA